MADQATAKYLQDNIGAILSKGLAEMAAQQPNDGVDFLAQYLRTYAEQEEIKIIREKEEKQMTQDRATTQKNEALKAASREEKGKALQSVEDGYKALLAKFNDTETRFDESFWTELVAVSKQYMGGQSAYLGMLDEEGLEDVEAPLIRYLFENVFAGSPTLLDKILPKMKDAETSNLTYNALVESVPEEERGAKMLWCPAPPPAPPVAEGEDPPPAPEGPKYLPVSVPCVTDTPIVHYFEMPRLGAYFACPLVYPSYYTQEAFAESRKFQEEKAERLRVKLEKEAERAAQIAEAEEKGTEVPEFPEEEEVPEPEMVLPGTTTKLVMCVDSLGTNTLFDESKFEAMMALCDACAACKARSEIKEVDGQALFAIGVERRELANSEETGLPRMREDAKSALQQPQEDEMKEIAERGLEGDNKGQVEGICAKKFVHLQSKMVVDYYKAHIAGFVRTCVTVTPEVLNIFAALAFLAGYTKAEVYPPRKTMLKWTNMQKLLDDKFFVQLETINLEVGKKGLSAEQKLTYIQSLLPADFNEEKAMEIDPAFAVLWNFLTTSIDYRSSALQQQLAEYNERKKAAAEVEDGPAFEEPEPATLDDDFEGLPAAP